MKIAESQLRKVIRRAINEQKNVSKESLGKLSIDIENVTSQIENLGGPKMLIARHEITQDYLDSLIRSCKDLLDVLLPSANS